MKSLTGLDATFLYLETPEMPMHVSSLNLCELPAGFKGSFHQEVTQHMAKRMHLAPLFSRKLVFMPLDLGHPLWVEADSVDIAFHLRRADPAKKSAAPMTLAEVHRLCAQLHGELIDRNFPLWEFYIFDRIKLPASQGGKIVAGFFSKIHHAALDGKGGVMLANALLDVSPVPREVPPPDRGRRRRLEADLKLGKMIGSVFSSSLSQLVKAARSLPAAASTFGSTLAKQSLASSATGVRPKMPMKLAPPSPFNAGIGPGRVFVTATIPLAECKATGEAVGGSFNDMVLWICSTALRDYLTQHHTLPKKSLVAAMPVSLRENGATDASTLDNQVSMSLVELGTHLAHPLKRMNAIMASTAQGERLHAESERPAAHELPVAASAVAGGRRGQAGAQCLRQKRAGQPPAHGGQPGDFQCARTSSTPLPGRRPVSDLPSTVHHHARPGTQHHHPDLCRPC